MHIFEQAPGQWETNAIDPTDPLSPIAKPITTLGEFPSTNELRDVFLVSEFFYQLHSLVKTLPVTGSPESGIGSGIEACTQEDAMHIVSVIPRYERPEVFRKLHLGLETDKRKPHLLYNCDKERKCVVLHFPHVTICRDGHISYRYTTSDFGTALLGSLAS